MSVSDDAFSALNDRYLSVVVARDHLFAEVERLRAELASARTVIERVWGSGRLADLREWLDDYPSTQDSEQRLEQ